MDFITVFCWLALCATSVAVVIEVDNNSGYDTESCYSESGGPCKTLDYAMTYGLTSSNTTIMIHEGVYGVNLLNLSFYDLENVMIYGAGSKLTVIKCSFGTGLGFFSITQFVLANFTLFGGGRIRYSTSINTTSDDVAVFRVALYLLDCSDVTIEGLVVTNSTGTGLVMYNVTGKIDVINSVFRFNIPLEAENLPGDGGVSIFFTYCKPGKTLQCNLSAVKGAFYNIKNCTFLSNIAASSDNTEIIKPTHFITVQQQFGRGGGLKILMREAQNNAVIIKDCNFLHNQAVWGGALFIELLNDSRSNHFVLENLLFDANCLSRHGFLNTTGTGGGAVRIVIIPTFHSNYNTTFNYYKTTFNFTNCTFLNNVADLGGGASFELIREKPNSSTYIYFANCTWYHNIGGLGSAIDAFVHTYPLGEVARFTFDSCSFIENSNDYSQLSVKSLGLGTMYLWSVPAYFMNKNVFIGNNGSALVGISTWCIFINETVVVFEKNTAENGGAITLLDNSYLVLFENTRLNFTHNTAAGKGGAIYTDTDGQRSFTSSKFCFVIFHDTTVSPYDWKEKNITVYFANNSAKYGNSIFTTTLLTCVWGELTKIQLVEIKQVYYWNGTFTYEGVNDVDDTKEEISSEATRIENLKNTSYTFPPGKLYYFNFVAKNDRNEAVDTVYFVTTNDSSVAVVDDTSSYTSEGNTMVYGAPESVVNLKMVTVNSLPLSISINVKVDDCPPGFYPSIEPRSNKTICKCSVNVVGQDYYGIVRCDSRNMVAYLTPSYFAGYKNFGNKKVLLTSSCPEGYCYHGTSSSVQLPSNASVQTLDDTVCKSQKRTGILCGKCSEGNYIFINSPNYPFECGKCSMPLWIEIPLLIITKYIPLIIFVIVIDFFNVNVLNSPLDSFVLFSQLLPFMDIYAGGRINILNQSVVKLYRLLYGMWNFNFLEIFLPGLCVVHTQSALNMLLFDNIITFVFVLYLASIINLLKAVYSSKFCHKENQCIIISFIDKITGSIKDIVLGKEETSKSFPMQNLLTLMILWYTKVTALGFDLLTDSTLYGPSKDDSEYHHRVFWLDGTKDYGKDNWYYIVIGSTCFIFIAVIPIVVCIYQWLTKRETNTFSDVCRDQCKSNPVNFFFPSLYFVYRICVLAISTYANDEKYIVMSCFFLSILVFHCWSHRYNNSFYYLADANMFINLTLISIISFYRLYAVTQNLSETTASFAIQTILIYLPLAYIVLLALWKQYLLWYKNEDSNCYVLKILYEFTENSSNGGYQPISGNDEENQ